MRAFIILSAVLAVALFVGCGTGDKPEFVEVPSGDPQPPVGDGEPIQDAEGDPLEACGEDQAQSILPPESLDLAPRQNPGTAPARHNLKVMPKSQRRIQKKTVGNLTMLLIPLFAAVLLRRRPRG